MSLDAARLTTPRHKLKFVDTRGPAYALHLTSGLGLEYKDWASDRATDDCVSGRACTSPNSRHGQPR